jgi:ankyrin repeat protein
MRWSSTISCPLHAAARSGYNGLVRELVSAGINVNSVKEFSNGDAATALHWAVYGQQLKTVKLLLELGADESVVGTIFGLTGNPLTDRSNCRSPGSHYQSIER